MVSKTTLDEQARAILRLNDRGGYTVPTAGLYPYQWNWDSAFAAFGFAQFDVPRAWQELETLFSGQWRNGMVPHILFHRPDPGYFPGADVWGTEGLPQKNNPILSSGISQPPVAASFAWRIYQRDPAQGKQHLIYLFPKLLAYHRWFMAYRAESGAVAITHPWEAGRDNAPDWDEAMASFEPEGVQPYTRRDTAHVDPAMRPTKGDYDRYIWLVQFARERQWDEAKIAAESPFRIADPTLTFTLLRAQRDLLAIAESLQFTEATAEIQQWVTQLEQGAEQLWNPGLGCYDAKDLRSGTFAGSVSNASFLCWYAGVHDERMRAPLARILGASKYALPSFDPSHDKFNSLRYWRGPVWGIMNMLVAVGLQDAGLSAEAERIRADTEALIGKNGFAEYFDPMSGAPAGGGTFTWTAAIWLGWVMGGSEYGRD